MSAGKVKASKFKVHAPPTGGDTHFHVFIYDVVAQSFQSGKSFDTVERAVSFVRHEQERIYTEQEAAPELFDLPFISSDPDLLARTGRDPAYKEQLIKELQAELRARERMR